MNNDSDASTYEPRSVFELKKKKKKKKTRVRERKKAQLSSFMGLKDDTISFKQLIGTFNVVERPFSPS